MQIHHFVLIFDESKNGIFPAFALLHPYFSLFIPEQVHRVIFILLNLYQNDYVLCNGE
jgi:hypothetical protein